MSSSVKKKKASGSNAGSMMIVVGVGDYLRTSNGWWQDVLQP